MKSFPTLFDCKFVFLSRLPNGRVDEAWDLIIPINFNLIFFPSGDLIIPINFNLIFFPSGVP